jgi:ankyrin repeat protein
MDETLRMIRAVASGDLAAVRQMLAEGTSLSVVHVPVLPPRQWYEPEPGALAKHNTPLHAAVEYQQHDAIGLLIEAGADPEEVVDGWGGWTPLLHAMDVERERAFARHQPLEADLTRLLIELGADVNSRRVPLTPLRAAIEWGHAPAAELLRAAGACLME